MAKATMKLIQELRAQLPPEAAEKLDDLESLAADEAPEEGDDSDMPADDMDDEVGAMYKGDDEEGSDEPVDVNATADAGMPPEDEEADMPPSPKAKKKPAKKGLSFFG